MGKRKKYPKRYRISLDSDACIGCLACTRCKVFEMREDRRAHAVFTELDDSGCCKEVAEACPVGAIVITPISNSGRR
ncbi:MAG: ferredoxin [Desulfobacterota bacterium]|nr:ferredoxin [Thermodesulfobacteriota bacterium]